MWLVSRLLEQHHREVRQRRRWPVVQLSNLTVFLHGLLLWPAPIMWLVGRLLSRVTDEPGGSADGPWSNSASRSAMNCVSPHPHSSTRCGSKATTFTKASLDSKATFSNKLACR